MRQCAVIHAFSFYFESSLWILCPPEEINAAVNDIIKI